VEGCGLRVDSALDLHQPTTHPNHIKIRFNQVFHPVPFFSNDVVQPAHPPGRSEDGHGLANRLEGVAETSLKEAANGVADDYQLPIQDKSFR